MLLVDTGVGIGNDHIDDRFKPHRTPIAEELSKFEIKTTDVNLVVNSHLHFDHCGNNRLFPNAKIYVQEKELEIARTTRYTVQEWFDYEGAQLNAVSGDLEIGTGITLLSSPGHTPGHQSVLIETTGGSVLVAAQAAFTAHEYQHGGNPADQAHEGLQTQYLDALARLKSIPADEVYFSHDDKTVGNI